MKKIILIALIILLPSLAFGRGSSTMMVGAGSPAGAPSLSVILITSDGKVLITGDGKFLRTPGTESWNKLLKTSDDKLLVTDDGKVLKTP